jgi:NACalpha-BTF3-like transcription factor
MYDIEPDRSVRTTDGERAIIGEWKGGRIDWFSSTATTLIDNDLATELLAKVENYKPKRLAAEPEGLQDVSYAFGDIDKVMTKTNAPREVVEDAILHFRGNVDMAIKDLKKYYNPEVDPHVAKLMEMGGPQIDEHAAQQLLSDAGGDLMKAIDNMEEWMSRGRRHPHAPQAEVDPHVAKLMEMGGPQIDEHAAQQLLSDAGGDLMMAIDFMNAMPTMPAMPAQQEELPPEVEILKKMGKMEDHEALQLLNDAGGDLMVAINLMAPDVMGGGSKGLKKKRLSNRKRSSRRKASRRKASRRRASRRKTSRRKTSRRKTSRRKTSRRKTSRRN